MSDATVSFWMVFVCSDSLDSLDSVSMGNTIILRYPLAIWRGGKAKNLVVDTPKTQAAIEHRREYAGISPYFIEIEPIIEAIDAIFDGFEESVDEVDPFCRTAPFIDAQDLRSESREYGEEVDEELESDDCADGDDHEHETQDDSAGDECDWDRRSTIIVAVTGDDLDSCDDILDGDDDDNRGL